MGERLVLRGASLLDPEAVAPKDGALLLERGRIASHLRPDEAPPRDAGVVDLTGRQLAPGFLDLHVHGSLVFAQSAELEAALQRDAAEMLRHGVTGFLATTVAWAPDELAAKVGRLAELVSSAGAAGATPLGLHLEGPWINPGAAGAQPGAAIRPFALAEGTEVLGRGEGLVRMVTFAPEAEGAADLQSLLEARGVVAALGHSLCSSEEADRAATRGARHVTHLFNSMGPFHHRSPGLTGVALADERLSCDLICDGVHVHPSAVRLAVRAKGTGLLWITDRIDPPMGGESSFGSGVLRDDGQVLRLADGRLAGSRLTLDRAIQNAIMFANLEICEAVAACTLRPARLLGIESERGTLRPGARADLAVLDSAGRVEQTWLAGQRIV